MIGGLLALALILPATEPPRPFAIEVVDRQTGRGVPLIELTTVNDIRCVTDSNGLVAFDEPGLMDQTVFFLVRGHGYEFPKDGFGYRGKAIRIEPGGSVRIEVDRINIAERLYRVTGQGIYADSVRLGRPVPTPHPVLNGQVFGSDSVVTAIYHDRIHWFWGDTNRPGYPLGNFNVPGAVSLLPARGGLDPDRGIDLTYYVDEHGFAKQTCPMPGEGPTWIGGLVVLRDSEGRERLYAGYVKVRPPLEIYEHGLAVFNDQAEQFEKVTAFPEGIPLNPQSHTFLYPDHGVEYVAFASAFPFVRAKANADDLAHPERYEGFTCLKPGTRPEQKQIDRDDAGRPRYGWKAGTPPLSPDDQDKLTKAGVLEPGEGILGLRDVTSGKPIHPHNGSVYWNDYRKRWVMILGEAGGSSSYLGEIWYVEADAPTGPWVYARKIVTHEKYSLYNPKHHPYFDRDGGRTIYFEGTYTRSFSGNSEATPRYEYNQILYKLDLSDPRLNLPVAVHLDEARGENGVASFFALDRPGPDTVPVFEVGQGDGRRLVVGAAGEPGSSPRFHAIPADSSQPPPGTVLFYECRSEDRSRTRYSAGDGDVPTGYRREEKPICRVWENPIRVPLPRP